MITQPTRDQRMNIKTSPFALPRAALILLIINRHYNTDFQCLYLDNLCVDFRCQRRSVGRALIEWGVHNASKKKIPIMTEASEEGSEFYKRLGFEQVDQWVIPTSGGATITTLAVLQLKAS